MTVSANSPWSEEEFHNAQIFCAEVNELAESLQQEGQIFARSPYNPFLTRAAAYNWYIKKNPTPLELNPMNFALTCLSAHRGLYGGPMAALEGDNTEFYEAFFGTKECCWPMASTWEHTWAIIGEDRLYPLIKFVPNRETCLMEDSRVIGPQVIASNQIKMFSQDESCEKEVTHYGVLLPTGHFASIHLQIRSEKSGNDYSVEGDVSAGNEGMGKSKWKDPREESIGLILGSDLNAKLGILPRIRLEPDRDGSVDLWLDHSGLKEPLAFQVTTLEPFNLYKELSNKKAFPINLMKQQLLDLVNEAIERKKKHSSNGIHLILDCGFVIPSSEAFETDVSEILNQRQVAYTSVWLVSRINKRVRCLYGDNPFMLQPASG